MPLPIEYGRTAAGPLDPSVSVSVEKIRPASPHRRWPRPGCVAMVNAAGTDPHGGCAEALVGLFVSVRERIELKLTKPAASRRRRRAPRILQDAVGADVLDEGEIPPVSASSSRDGSRGRRNVIRTRLPPCSNPRATGRRDRCIPDVVTEIGTSPEARVPRQRSDRRSRSRVPARGRDCHPRTRSCGVRTEKDTPRARDCVPPARGSTRGEAIVAAAGLNRAPTEPDPVVKSRAASRSGW